MTGVVTQPFCTTQEEVSLLLGGILDRMLTYLLQQYDLSLRRSKAASFTLGWNRLHRLHRGDAWRCAVV